MGPPKRANTYHREMQGEKYSSTVTIMQGDKISILFLPPIQEGPRRVLLKQNIF